MAELFRRVIDGVEDVRHDAVELLIDFFESPGETFGVLAHFEAGCRDATGVCRLGRSEEDARFLERFDGFRGGRHVGAFGNSEHAVLDECFRSGEVEFVLGCARKGDVALHGPHALAAFVVFGALDAFGVFLDASALDFFDVLHDVELDAVRVIDVSVRVGHGDDFRAKGLRLFASVDGDVSGTGDDDRLAFEGIVLHLLQHFAGEVAEAVARRFGARERTAVGKTLAGENAGPFVAEALVLSEHVADFTCARADIAGRNVRVRTDMLRELGHEGLAEAHHFGIALAFRIEVGTALAATHGKSGEAVFENLLEAEELENRGVDGRMETETALVRSDGGVELDAVAAIDLDVSLVIDPGDAEDYLAFRFDDAVDDAVRFVGLVLFDDRFEGFEKFADSLVEFGFARIFGDNFVVNFLEVCVCECHLYLQ